MAVALLLSLPLRPASAQTVRYRLTWADPVSISVATLLYISPSHFGMPRAKFSCTPCDPANLIGIDRWAVRPVSVRADIGSDVSLYFVAGWTALAGLGGLSPQQWQGNLATFANTAIWTSMTAEWMKVLVRRNRPIMYTKDAQAATAIRSSQLSMPSGHAALSFAIATTYLVVSGRENLPHRARNALLIYGGAVSVSTLRVVAGKHFPTDVLVGALLGTVIGAVVPAIHPRTTIP